MSLFMNINELNKLLFDFDSLIKWDLNFYLNLFIYLISKHKRVQFELVHDVLVRLPLNLTSQKWVKKRRGEVIDNCGS